MQVRKINLTEENLIKIKEIDEVFYQDARLTLNWYLERYKDYHQALILCDENNKWCGYLVSIPIKKELYDTIINGVLIDDLDVNPNMFVEKSNYNYIVSCIILSEFRNKGYGKLLMENLLKNKKGNYCALTVSQDGYYLANKFMKLRKKVNDKINVFEIKL